MTCSWLKHLARDSLDLLSGKAGIKEQWSSYFSDCREFRKRIELQIISFGVILRRNSKTAFLRPSIHARFLQFYCFLSPYSLRMHSGQAETQVYSLYKHNHLHRSAYINKKKQRSLRGISLILLLRNKDIIGVFNYKPRAGTLFSIFTAISRRYQQFDSPVSSSFWIFYYASAQWPIGRCRNMKIEIYAENWHKETIISKLLIQDKNFKRVLKTWFTKLIRTHFWTTINRFASPSVVGNLRRQSNR